MFFVAHVVARFVNFFFKKFAVIRPNFVGIQSCFSSSSLPPPFFVCICINYSGRCSPVSYVPRFHVPRAELHNVFLHSAVLFPNSLFFCFFCPCSRRPRRCIRRRRSYPRKRATLSQPSSTPDISGDLSHVHRHTIIRPKSVFIHAIFPLFHLFLVQLLLSTSRLRRIRLSAFRNLWRTFSCFLYTTSALQRTAPYSFRVADDALCTPHFLLFIFLF